jgi:hypothetical protein
VQDARRQLAGARDAGVERVDVAGDLLPVRDISPQTFFITTPGSSTTGVSPEAAGSSR